MAAPPLPDPRSVSAFGNGTKMKLIANDDVIPL